MLSNSELCSFLSLLNITKSFKNIHIKLKIQHLHINKPSDKYFSPYKVKATHLTVPLS